MKMEIGCTILTQFVSLYYAISSIFTGNQLEVRDLNSHIHSHVYRRLSSQSLLSQ